MAALDEPMAAMSLTRGDDDAPDDLARLVTTRLAEFEAKEAALRADFEAAETARRAEFENARRAQFEAEKTALRPDFEALVEGAGSLITFENRKHFNRAFNLKSESKRVAALKRVCDAAKLNPPFKCAEMYVNWFSQTSRWMVGGTNTPLKHVAFYLTLEEACEAKRKRLGEMNQENDEGGAEAPSAAAEE